MRKANTLYRNGPLYLVKRGNFFAIHGTVDGQVIRLSAKTDDLRRAKIALNDLLSRVEGGWWRDENDGDISWKDVAKVVCNRHRYASRVRGIPFELTAIDVYHSMRATSFRCAVSGVPLSRRVKPNELAPDPWGASIDRIENRHGYTLDNFRVVCFAANIAMNRWGLDVLLRLAKGVVRSSAAVIPEKLAHPMNNESQETAQVIDLSERIAV